MKLEDENIISTKEEFYRRKSSNKRDDSDNPYYSLGRKRSRIMSKNNVLSPDTENKVALYFQNKLWWTMQQIKFKSYYLEKYMFDPSEKSFTT